MTLRTALVGIVAGLAAALLFASTLSGSAIAIILFYVAALPIMIVGLGWRHLAAIVAAVAGALALGIGLVPIYGAVFAVSVALPAWILCYFILLGRTDPGGQVVEWYPIGRVVAIAAAIAAALGMTAALAMGPDHATFSGTLHAMVEEVLRYQFGTPEGQPLRIPDVEDASAVVRVVTAVVPPAMAVLWTLVTLLNLWLAGRVVATSGLLVRPWPPVPLLRLPTWSAAALAAGLLASFGPGMVGLAGELVVAAFLCAFMIQGFAVIHTLTRGSGARAFVLGGLYVLCFVMSWPLLLVALFGLADQFLDLRGRTAARKASSHANDNSHR